MGAAALGIAALARVVAALAALAALVVEIEASPNARARTPGRLHHAHLRHESVVFILEFGELGAFGRVARRRGDGARAKPPPSNAPISPPKANANATPRPRPPARDATPVWYAGGCRRGRRVRRKSPAPIRSSRLASIRSSRRRRRRRGSIRRGHGDVCTFATTPGESYGRGASVDRPSVVETSARTAAAAAAASAMDRRGLVVRTTVPVSVPGLRASLGIWSLSSSEGRGGGPPGPCVCGGGRVGGVRRWRRRVGGDGAGACRNAGRGRAGRRSGGTRGAGEVAQRERASAGERHAEEGAGEEDARARAAEDPPESPPAPLMVRREGRAPGVRARGRVSARARI